MTLNEDEGRWAPTEPQEDERDLDAGLLSNLRAAISATDWTVETLVSQLRKGNIFLDPEFQRRDAWSIQRKSQYLESLVLGLPTPQIILAERKEQRGTYIVIDGKQRLLSLRQFSAKENDTEFERFNLKGLEVRNDLNGLEYDDLTNPSSVFYAPDFENATIRTVVIKSYSSETYLYEVFLRINSGSVQLSPQELRQALHPGPFTTALNRFVLESQAVRDLLGLSKPDFRMRDNEIVLRYVAFQYFLQDYRGNLKQFLDDATSDFNDDWNEYRPLVLSTLKDFERVINVTREIFGPRGAFRSWNGERFEGRVNRAVIDVMAYYFTLPQVAKQALQKKEQVVEAFKELCNEDEEFRQAISGTTKSLGAVEARFALWGQTLDERIGIRVEPAFTYG